MLGKHLANQSGFFNRDNSGSPSHMESNFYIIDPVKRKSPEQVAANETKLSRGLKQLKKA